MKILESITSKYKKIAAGIAIVSFLAIMYIALIPGGLQLASAGVVTGMGVGIPGATVKIVEYPQYNNTTAPDGTYIIPNVPYDANTGSTYTLRFSAPGNGSNTSAVTLTALSHDPAVSMDLYPSEPRYIPNLADVGVFYESKIQIFNPYDFNTTADVTVYNDITKTNSTTTFEIPINTMGSRYPRDIVGGNFLGATKVVFTRPQSLVQGTLRTVSSNIYSITPSFKLQSDNIQYIPYLADVSTFYDSGIQIFNPNDINITANLTGYNDITKQNTTLSFEVVAKQYKAVYAGEVAGGYLGANVNFVGSVKVNTTLPALVQGNIRTLSTNTATIAPAVKIGTATEQYIPYLADVSTFYDSGIQIFNPNDINITANVTGYNDITKQNTTLSFEVVAKQYRAVYAGEVAGGYLGANVNFVGSIKVNTTLPALVQGNIRTLSTSTATIAPAMLIPVETVQYIPFLNDTGTISSSGFDSGIQVFNPNEINLTATITAYNLLNNLTTSLSFEVPAKQYKAVYAGEVAGGALGQNVDFVGSVKVSTTLRALVQGNIRTLSSSTATIAKAIVIE